MSPLRRTPLYPVYSSYPSVRCIDFGGWELPVQYYGMLREHDAVRRQAGLFDVSHMGELLVTGEGALAFLQRITTNDVSRLTDGRAQYSILCAPDGGVVDDLIVYRLASGKYMLVVNSANAAKDFEWLQRHRFGDVRIDDISEDVALLALQGPAAAGIMSQAASAAVLSLPAFHFASDVNVSGTRTLVSRTGYTGEDGFELFVSPAEAPKLWNDLMRAGERRGLIPAGLGARDTLRLEARLPLYGQDMSEDVSPLEAGLGSFVKWDKGEFIGKEALLAQRSAGLPRKLVGIRMIGRGIPRSGYGVYASGKRIGVITSGTQSPTLKQNIGLALLDANVAEVGTELQVDIRGKFVAAQVVKTPFYRRTAESTEGGKRS